MKTSTISLIAVLAAHTIPTSATAQATQQVIPVGNVPGDDTASLAAAFGAVGNGPAKIVLSPGTY